jgi:hypothetical protein
MTQTPGDIWQSKTDADVAALQIKVDLLERQMAEIMDALQKLTEGKTP